MDDCVLITYIFRWKIPELNSASSEMVIAFHLSVVQNKDCFERLSKNKCKQEPVSKITKYERIPLIVYHI